MMRSTDPRPVSGRVQVLTIFAEPSLATCSMSAMTRSAPFTRSIAPPMPLIILPGTVQFAMSPLAETCIAPRTAVAIRPPRIMPKLVEESKKDAPGSTVTVSLPALISLALSSPAQGYGPTPSMPFSECSTMVLSAGRKFGMRVGRPMPRLT